MSDLVKVVSAAIIRDGRLLLVKKNGVHIPPGGKPKTGENDEDCLRREIREELSDTEVLTLTPYKSFRGLSISGRNEIEAVIYRTDINGELGRPSGEIDDYAWVLYSSICTKYRVSQATIRMAVDLHRDKFF